MPANEFEKQVKVIMEDLKLSPSPPVWENIEEQIKKKKDRKRVIFWFLFLFLILAGGLWFTIGKNDAGIDSQKAKLEQQNPASPGTTPDVSQKNKNVLVDKKNENTTAIITSSENKKTTVTKSFIDKKHFSDASKPQKSVTNPIRIKQPDIAIAKDQDQSFKSQPAAEQQISPAISSPKTDERTEIQNVQQLKTESQMISATKPNEDSKEKIDSTADTKQPGIETSNLNEQKNKKSKNNKWQKGITADIGWSNYNHGLFHNSAADRYSFSNVQSSGGISPVVYAPQQNKKGIAFTIGGNIQRSMGKRIKISVGLEYHYYSAQTRIGTAVKKDTMIKNTNGQPTSVSRFYTYGNQSDYTNAFHIVEVPLTFEYRPFNNIPISLSVGISYGHMLHTSALTYSRYSNLYYNDQSNYVKNYISIFSSVQYSWLRKNKLEIRSGPIYRYAANDLQHAPAYGTPHLFFVGLRTNVIFK